MVRERRTARISWNQNRAFSYMANQWNEYEYFYFSVLASGKRNGITATVVPPDIFNGILHMRI